MIGMQLPTVTHEQVNGVYFLCCIRWMEQYGVAFVPRAIASSDLKISCVLHLQFLFPYLRVHSWRSPLHMQHIYGGTLKMLMLIPHNIKPEQYHKEVLM